nr:hypothetical protein BaRGS_021051 [Batillaria attramentaria]
MVLGGFGNVATIFVLRRINWGQSTQHVFLTALAVVDLCLLCTGPLRMYVFKVVGGDLKFVAKAYLAFSVTHMLWYTNSAVNFLLYCVSGTKFRNAFVTWITCGSDSIAQASTNLAEGYTRRKHHKELASVAVNR